MSETTTLFSHYFQIIRDIKLLKNSMECFLSPSEILNLSYEAVNVVSILATCHLFSILWKASNTTAPLSDPRKRLCRQDVKQYDVHLHVIEVTEKSTKKQHKKRRCFLVRQE